MGLALATVWEVTVNPLLEQLEHLTRHASSAICKGP